MSAATRGISRANDQEDICYICLSAVDDNGSIAVKIPCKECKNSYAHGSCLTKALAHRKINYQDLLARGEGAHNFRCDVCRQHTLCMDVVVERHGIIAGMKDLVLDILGGIVWILAILCLVLLAFSGTICACMTLPRSDFGRPWCIMVGILAILSDLLAFGICSISNSAASLIVVSGGLQTATWIVMGLKRPPNALLVFKIAFAFTWIGCYNFYQTAKKRVPPATVRIAWRQVQ